MMHVADQEVVDDRFDVTLSISLLHGKTNSQSEH